MGLFSKKPKMPVYDPVECEAKKKRMREMFNEAVADGDSYEILRGGSQESRTEIGFVWDTRITNFYYYIIGYRKSDFQIVLVQINNELTQHGDAYYIDMPNIHNVKYNPKIQQVYLIYRKNNDGPYCEALTISDADANSLYGIKNTVQPQEREAFLDFLESFRARLERQGLKLDKWKRN